MSSLKKFIQRKSFIIAAAAILAYTLAGFFLAPYLVKHYLPKIVQEKIGKNAAVGEVRVNPYLFTFEANEFRLTEPDGRPILGFNRLFVDFELKSLFKWAWTFRQINLEGPAINAVIQKDGSLNLANFAPPSESSSPQETNGEPPRLILEDVVIEQGRIDFTDLRQSEPAAVAFQPLHLQMKDISTLPGREGNQAIIATSGEGGTFKWSGNISLNPVAGDGNFSIENLKISTLSKFFRDALNVEEPEGRLTIDTDYRLDLGTKEPQLLLSNLSVALTGVAFKLKGEKTPFLELPDTLLSDARLDLSGRQLNIGGIAIKGGKARLEVGKDGTLDVKRIIKANGGGAPTASQPSQPVDATKPWKVRLSALDIGSFAIGYTDLSRTPALKAGIGELQVRLKAEAQAGNETQALLSDLRVGIKAVQAGFMDVIDPVIRLDALDLEGGAYNLADNRLSVEAVRIEGGAADVRREADGALNLALLFPKKKEEEGAAPQKETGVASKGQPFRFLFDTVALSGLKVALSDLTVRDDGPVLSIDDISTNLSNVDGRSPMKFDFDIKVKEGGRIQAAGTADPSMSSVDSTVQVAELGLTPLQPYIEKAAAVALESGAFSTKGILRHGIKSAGSQSDYKGSFKIKNLRVVEVGGNETLVGWKSLQSDRFKLQLEPNEIDVGEIKISRPAGKIIIEKDHTLNLTNVIKSDAQSKRDDKQGPSAGAFPYRIHRILIDKGQVDFADLSLPIPFGARVHELKGALAGISSAKNARAQVKLSGQVNDYGTAKVDGELNGSDPKAFTDIGVAFRNVEMSRLTPYSGKFAGRKIDSGKLSVDLKYKIDKGQLAGENHFVVDRLSLGEKVESPDAVDLPLDLAVALLEDSNGVIDLGLPVHGSLDSPEFSFGALIGKAIVNLLTKIVTSPFRALAALIPGGGEEAFKNIAFEPGSAVVPPPEKEKLAKLAEALRKRPQLKLAVQGRYNPESDYAALRTAGLSRALAERLGQKAAPELRLSPVDYSSPGTVKALAAMFSERFGEGALKAIEGELKAEEDKAKKEASGKDNAQISEAEDPGRLAKRLFRKLEQVEPVDEAALVKLANVRAQAVLAELSGVQAIPAERLDAKPSAAQNKADPASAELTLDVMK